MGTQRHEITPKLNLKTLQTRLEDNDLVRNVRKFVPTAMWPALPRTDGETWIMVRLPFLGLSAIAGGGAFSWRATFDLFRLKTWVILATQQNVRYALLSMTSVCLRPRSFVH